MNFNGKIKNQNRSSFISSSMSSDNSKMKWSRYFVCFFFRWSLIQLMHFFWKNAVFIRCKDERSNQFYLFDNFERNQNSLLMWNLWWQTIMLNVEDLLKEERATIHIDNDDHKLQPIKSHHKQINLFHHLSFDLSDFFMCRKRRSAWDRVNAVF